MISYRKAKISDSSQIAKLHIESFPNFFLTTLGYSFLKTYYSSCTKSKGAISICAIDNEKKIIVGFAVGCLNSAGFNKRLICSNLSAYVYQVIVVLFSNPLALVRLSKNIKKGNVLIDNGDYSELLSIGVSPEQNGLGIGQELLVKFEKLVSDKGICKVTLTSDAHANKNVLNFYKKSGYTVYYEFETFPKRKMLKLIKEI